jgi:hypothetical protein
LLLVVLTLFVVKNCKEVVINFKKSIMMVNLSNFIFQ